VVPPPGSRDDGDVRAATGGSLVPPGVSGAPLKDCSKGLGSRLSEWPPTEKAKRSGVLPEGCGWAGRGGGASGLVASALDVVVVAVVVDGAASFLGPASSLDSGLASGRGGDGMRDCLGEFESPEPAAPVDDPMMSIENLAVVAVLCCGRGRPTTAEGEKGEGDEL